MKTHDIIVFDSLFGNIFLKPIAFLLKIKKYLFNKQAGSFPEPKTILICKFKGMGSIIQSTPLIKSLRNNFPNARLVYLSTSANKTLLDKIDILDEVLTLNDSTLLNLIKGLYYLIIKLKELQIDYYYDLEVYSNFSAFTTSISGAKIKSGFYTQKSSFRKSLYHNAVQFEPGISVNELHIKLTKFRTLHEDAHTEKNSLYCFKSDIDYPGRLFQKLGITSKRADNWDLEYILINPNTSDLRIERRWPKENFIVLIEKICHEFPEVKIILTGNRQEIEYTTGIVTKINPYFRNNVVSAAGKITLDEFSSLLEHSLLFITNDTGPMHLAFSLNIRTLALFGPCNPEFYEIPFQTKIYYKRVTCSPCVHTTLLPPCWGNNVCMKSISMEEVFKEASECLAKNNLQVKTATF
ncbi:MAG: hypothetical protein A3H98_03285 [Bacteroidetes bacterium RIFCSPLOWO2_02_FULL_36_8]|nr:MAG: hypothetical protein A3H98_03285 [Bacteroidetes bacterium RIFCSPLOWO2_02_FULL_36_8]OFY71372.1 MAG: hypothetical protein A3G23_04260 [Bacteroidetes bacterium RIFCSPLOWO2_12_FULL_37_12]